MFPLDSHSFTAAEVSPLLWVGALVLSSGVGSAHASDYAVDSDQDTNMPSNVCQATPTGTCTLRAALDLAQNGDRVFFVPGTYQTIQLTSELFVPGGVTVEGLPDEGVVLSAGGNHRVLRTNESGAVVRDLVLEDGFDADVGGGVLVHLSGSMTLERVIFRNNTVSGGMRGGGGLAVVSSALGSCIDCLFEGNEALGGAVGGALYVSDSANMSVVRSTFDQNVSAATGGALAGRSSRRTLIYNSNFVRNRAASGGAAVWADGAVGIAYSSFLKNVRPGLIARDERGGVMIDDGGEIVAESLGDVIVFYSVIEALIDSGVVPCDVSGSATLDFGAVLSNDPSCTEAGNPLLASDPGLADELSPGPGVSPVLALRADSPAVDGGVSFPCTQPFSSGVITEDVRALPRGVDADGDGFGQCDLGAFEAQWFFADGFESGDLLEWSTSSP